MNTVRVNLTLPTKLVEELRKFHKVNMSKFVSEAVKKELYFVKRINAMKELNKMPPAFPDIKDSSKYIHDMRMKEGKIRDKKVGLL